MSHYTDEDYARDLQAKTISDVLGSLNVAKFDLDRLTRESKGKTLSKAEWGILEACKARVPILQAELKRRGETEHDWMYPATMFKDNTSLIHLLWPLLRRGSPVH